ncbi:MAG: hypothetical protein JWR75_1087 [Devosia sp.]|nr:hypothetical protein [Devosia sp.]
MTAINLPEIVAEVEAVFHRYELALLANDNATLLTMFLDHPATLRYGVADLQYGYPAIAEFRATQLPFERTLEALVITTYGTDFAVASTLFHRPDLPDGIGRQQQIWVRVTDGWKVAAAHVSMMPKSAVPEAARQPE